ncbi:hypothetical protein QYF36_003972 [Acer negundo]|nr:hypothetical protein QYF36_003972 [Acer negundo]
MGLSGMCLRFVLLQMLLLMVAAAAPKPTPLAKPEPNCPDLTKCGDLEIPYPFGTKPGCYLSRDFLITCNENTNISYWGNSNINVTNISMEGRLQVLSPVSRECNNSQRFGASLNVGNFRISSTQNIFTVIGCDSYGYIHGKIDKRNYSVSCNSSCENSADVIDGSCPGPGCCQITIPKDLRGIRVYASSSNEHKNVSQFNQCSYAFVIEENKFHFSSSNLSDIAEKVPTVVDWAITGQGNCKNAKKKKATYVCKKNTLCKDSIHSAGGYLCQCKDGYQGNPYLGCKCNKNCNQLPLGLGVGIGSVTLLAGSYRIYYEFRKRRLIKLKQMFFLQNGGSDLLQQLSDPGGTGDAATIFPANDLEMATNNFNEETIIGKGRNGPVYKAILKDNNPVAIKKSMKMDRTQTKQFIDQGRLSRILDNGIISNDKITNQQIKQVAELASRCLNVKGEERPSMKEVAMELKRLNNVEGDREEIENLGSETSGTGSYVDGNNSTAMYDSMKDQVSEGFDGGIED